MKYLCVILLFECSVYASFKDFKRDKKNIVSIKSNPILIKCSLEREREKSICTYESMYTTSRRSLNNDVDEAFPKDFIPEEPFFPVTEW